jgi:hypothetical protein
VAVSHEWVNLHPWFQVLGSLFLLQNFCPGQTPHVSDMTRHRMAQLIIEIMNKAVNKHRKSQRSLAERRFIHALIHKADIVPHYINFNRPSTVCNLWYWCRMQGLDQKNFMQTGEQLWSQYFIALVRLTLIVYASREVIKSCDTHVGRVDNASSHPKIRIRVMRQNIINQ